MTDDEVSQTDYYATILYKLIAKYFVTCRIIFDIASSEILWITTTNKAVRHVVHTNPPLAMFDEYEAEQAIDRSSI